jgi:hypothetical protein
MRGALRCVLVAAFVLSLAATGCGGDTESGNRYVTAVNKAQADFVAIVDDAESRQSQDSSDSETAAQLDDIRTAATKVVRDLRAIEPPGKTKALHARLVQEAQSLVTAFANAADAYRSADPSRILSAKVDLNRDVSSVNTQMNATIQALNGKLHD